MVPSGICKDTHKDFEPNELRNKSKKAEHKLMGLIVTDEEKLKEREDYWEMVPGTSFTRIRNKKSEKF